MTRVLWSLVGCALCCALAAATFGQDPGSGNGVSPAPLSPAAGLVGGRSLQEKPRTCFEFTEDANGWKLSATEGLAGLINDEFLLLYRCCANWPDTPGHCSRLISLATSRTDASNSIHLDLDRSNGPRRIACRVCSDGVWSEAVYPGIARYQGMLCLLVHCTSTTLTLYMLDGSTNPPSLRSVCSAGSHAGALSGVISVLDIGDEYCGNSPTHQVEGTLGPIMLKVADLPPITDANVLKWLLDPEAFWTCGPTAAWGSLEVDSAEVHPAARMQLDDATTVRWLDTIGAAHLTLTSICGATCGEPFVYPDFCGNPQQQAIFNNRVNPIAIADGDIIWAAYSGLTQYALEGLPGCYRAVPCVQKCDGQGKPISWPVLLPTRWAHWDSDDGVLEEWMDLNNHVGDVHDMQTVNLLGDDLIVMNGWSSDRFSDTPALTFHASTPSWQLLKNKALSGFGAEHMELDYNKLNLRFDGCDTAATVDHSATTYMAQCPADDRMLFMTRTSDAHIGNLVIGSTHLACAGPPKRHDFQNIQDYTQPMPTMAGHPVRILEFLPGKFLFVYANRYNGTEGYRCVLGLVCEDATDLSRLRCPNSGAPLPIPWHKDCTAERCCRIGTHLPGDNFWVRAVTDGDGHVWIFQLIDHDSDGVHQKDLVVDTFRVVHGVWNGDYFDWSEHEGFNFPAVAQGHAVNGIRTPVAWWGRRGVLLLAWADEAWGANPTMPYTGIGDTDTNDSPGMTILSEQAGTHLHVFVNTDPYDHPDSFHLLHSDLRALEVQYAGTTAQGLMPVEWGNAADVSPLGCVQVIHESAISTQCDGGYFDFFEVPEIPYSSCASADLDGDGFVSQSDLAILLAHWKEDAGGDIDGDGDTDQADLGALLGEYGETCR